MPPLDAAEGLGAPGSWIELSVVADQEAVEAVSEILSRACPGGVALEAPFQLAEEGLAARLDPLAPAVVRGYVPALDGAAARAAVERVRRDLGHLQAFGLRPLGELETRIVHEDDWAQAWKRHFPVLRIGRRVVVRPTWRRHRRRTGDVVVALDPGMAFGTGLHPTTRLCLETLEDWAEAGLIEGRRVLDVGCGSGILGICAGLLGARLVVGVDTDPLAVEATQANAARNGLETRLIARRGSLPLSGDETGFELVLANLVAGVLIELAGELHDALAPDGGRLLASGIFADREGEVRGAFEAAGMAIAGRRSEGDWLAIETVRRSA